jgi:uncharacterized protein YmfQ (DUF2313 family)
MTTPFAALDAADFGVAVQNLLPRGRAWSHIAAPLLAAFTQSIGDALFLMHATEVLLLETESFPATAVQMLPDLLADYGLPTEANGGVTADLLGRIASIGGQTAPYFISVAAAMAYSASVTTFEPFYCGASLCGDPIGDWRWWFGWEVNAAAGAVANLQTTLAAIGPATGTVWVNIA